MEIIKKLVFIMKFLLILLLAAVGLNSTEGSMLHLDALRQDIIFQSNSTSEPNLEDKWGGLWPFQGINTFAHLEHTQCLIDRNEKFDIGIIGVPFDTATSYRPGARFGPRAIRAASQRQTSLRGYNQRAGINPYASWARILDCGDIPVTPVDNSLAFKQMDMAFDELLLEHKSLNNTGKIPRFIALGGDHSILLPHIRALHKHYGRLNIIHFDAHIDTWAPDKYPSFWHSDQSEVTHGSMLWKAYEEGLTSEHNIHAGIRTKLSGIDDYLDDDEQHFTRITADEIWLKGAQYVINKIYEVVPKNTPTYISIDIDVLDPGFGSGTGTQEPGGWLPRELIYVLRSIDELSIVGADIVEVSPSYDSAEITATNGAQVVFELLTSMVKKGELDFSSKDVENEPLVKVNRKGTQTALSIDHTNVDETIDEKLRQFEQLKSKLMQDIADLRSMYGTDA